jgi:adenosylcobyric acid synthase
MQAEAAGIEPDVRMNPVLLKPTTDVGSQVIVGGEVWQNMTARDYFARKTELFPAIDKAYETLSEQHDILVIEGAGSPVELNLKRDDIVNMGLAMRVKSPVLLVGDIDRGGIFAQLLGTLGLLEPEERALVRGLIVNNVRGVVRLFSDGIRILEERGGVPVLGVVPHITADIEDEDSLSEKLGAKANTGLIDIAVIRLPLVAVEPIPQTAK